MTFFVILLSFFAVYGLIFKTGEMIDDKGRNVGTKNIKWGIGLAAGVLLFIPTTEYDFASSNIANANSDNGKVLAGYDVMQTNWQSFERDGYSIFSDWANKLAKVTIDSEMQAIINKTGIGTADQITQAYAGKVMYQKLYSYSSNIQSYCNNNYDTTEMYMTSDNKKYKYSNNSQTPFPTDENYGYAMALHNGAAGYYYKTLPKEGAYSTNVINYYNSAISSTDETYDIVGRYFYPRMSLSMCGKNFFQNRYFQKRYVDYKNQLKKLEATGTTDNLKLNLIGKLITFQYGLYNDWGYMSVLGLPAVELFTDLVGGLYDNPSDKVLTSLDNQIEENDESKSVMHKIMSSIPYLMLPGSSEVYTVAKNSLGSIAGTLNNIPF